MLQHPDTPTADQAIQLIGHAPSPSTLRGLEVGALLQAATALHLDGLLTDAEYRAKRRRLADQL